MKIKSGIPDHATFTRNILVRDITSSKPIYIRIRTKTKIIWQFYYYYYYYFSFFFLWEKKHLPLIDKGTRTVDKKVTAEKEQGSIKHQQDKTSLGDTKP